VSNRYKEFFYPFFQHKECNVNTIEFTFSDALAGYVTAFDSKTRSFSLRSIGEREYRLTLTDTTEAEIIRNLDEPYQGVEGSLEGMLTTGRFLFAYGIFYPEGGSYLFEVKHLIFVGRGIEEYRFEEPNWWVRQIHALADFYFRAQFPDGIVNYCNYRTQLTLEGTKIESTRQETDTISRMIYGFATAFLLTGEERFLEAAQRGTEYLREHMRAVDEEEQIVYWYHAMDIRDGRERKILSSQFGDDYESIPAYEQIYALVGPVQTYRVTGDPLILRDAEMTVNLFNKFFRDPEYGGYFSHIDPVTLSPRSDALGQGRARKNWNSIGDHAPAYLINLWLATGNPLYEQMLVTTADLITRHFPDDEHSPFVQERFYADWSQNTTWGWQQNRAVVGHNLKIAWNLMRIHHLQPDQRYTALAKKIAMVMPTVGMDRQRGGWYDVLARTLPPGEHWHRFVWHDRKAWWQQEQAILAYLILSGSLREDEHRRLARESEAFYNSFFLDHDNGGIYFNVLANGIPYLLGTERLKGSHSMSGYHSFELCFLSAVYNNLLLNKQPMDFYFKTSTHRFPDNVLRVQPDLLPAGSVSVTEVWINDQPYHDFDAVAMTVRLPEREGDLNIRVRLQPTGMLFDSQLDINDEVAILTLYGELNEAAAPAFKAQLDQIIAARPRRIVLRMTDLRLLANGSARALSFVVEKLALDKDITVEGANTDVRCALQRVGVWEEMISEGDDALV
jgi:mannose/cellobiose epimerase-like protein (N-acyl-D-glucosamine 2-epimerase family)/anti-anti-sigma regulatory factor